jgi:hypothetical protein
MKTITYACGAAIIAAALATPAMAQNTSIPQGTYAGTSADGNSVQFVVGTDPNNEGDAVTAFTIFFSAPCANSTYVLNTGWGVGTLNDINANNRVTIAVDGGYYTFSIALHFDIETQTATGTVLSISPTLYPVGRKPTRGLICTSPTQALSVTLQPSSDGAKNKLAPGTQINLPSPRANDDSALEANH